MAEESIQGRLDRGKTTRVTLLYEVETNGAREKKHVPFVVGVLSDLGGDTAARKPIEVREWREVDAGTIDQLMREIKPRIRVEVEDKLAGDGSPLTFMFEPTSMEDFTPERVAEKIEKARPLLEARRQLSTMLTTLTTNYNFSSRLQEILTNTEQLQQLFEEAGL